MNSTTHAQVVGLLHSQIGYDMDAPKRLVLRGPEGWLADGARVSIRDSQNSVVWQGDPRRWGTVWGATWWEVDFGTLRASGHYIAYLERSDGSVELASDPFEVGEQMLFQRTAYACGPGHLDKRRLLAKVKPGWFDAGALWQLVSSHAVQIIGLCDMVRFAGEHLEPAVRAAYLEKIEDGATYLGMCHQSAAEKGFGEGALIQCLAMVVDQVSPHDSFTAAVAFALASECLQASRPEKAEAFRRDAERCLQWALEEGKPWSHIPYYRDNQGLPEELTTLQGWPTRYLMLGLYAEVVLCSLQPGRDPGRVEHLSKQILARQIPQEQAEQGCWGHFYAYDACHAAEKSWSHSMPPQDYSVSYQFDSDNGMSFAHPLFCFAEAIRRLPQHALVGRWKEALTAFARHYFLPLCRKTPFSLMPRGFFGESEPIWFAGVWHGCNVSYGIAAGLALEFERLLGDRQFGDLAYGNLQWIAGLHAGLTQEAIEVGCTISTQDIPAGRAVPASFIRGIGSGTAGCWTNIRGSICNGFGTGVQFVKDVPPQVTLDRPQALHDEDWITHNGGFLIGLSRWRARLT
jgi:hypothetical protein